MRIWALREQELAIFFKKLPNVRAIRSKVRPAGVGGVTPPNMYEIARSRSKSRPCCKRVGYGIFVTFIVLLTVVG